LLQMTQLCNSSRFYISEMKTYSPTGLVLSIIALQSLHGLFQNLTASHFSIG
jgi:hypothetical protein